MSEENNLSHERISDTKLSPWEMEVFSKTIYNFYWGNQKNLFRITKTIH